MKKESVLFMVVCALMLMACAAGPNVMVHEHGAGFCLGLWHGMIIFFTLIGSLFTDNVSIYEVSNNGSWYDVGFYLGVGMMIGGSGGMITRRRSRRDD